MKNERSYSAKSILIALGKSALYLLFFLAVQFFVVVIYGIVVAANAAINGETDLVRGGTDGRQSTPWPSVSTYADCVPAYCRSAAIMVLATKKAA